MKLSRRDFLRSAAMASAGIAAVACQPQTFVVKETVEVEVEKEVTAIVEREIGAAHEPEPRLVDQRRGLQRVVSSLAAHELAGEAV